MDLLHKLFKREENDAPPSPQDASLAERLAEVSTVITALNDYYRSHATTGNEILVKVALTLNAYQLALMRVLSRPTLGEAELREVADHLAPSDADHAARIRAVAPLLNDMLPRDRDKVRGDLLRELKTGVNMYADIGRQLLQVREWRARGMSEARINQLLSAWRVKNIF